MRNRRSVHRLQMWSARPRKGCRGQGPCHLRGKQIFAKYVTREAPSPYLDVLSARLECGVERVSSPQPFLAQSRNHGPNHEDRLLVASGVKPPLERGTTSHSDLAVRDGVGLTLRLSHHVARLLGMIRVSPASAGYPRRVLQWLTSVEIRMAIRPWGLEFNSSRCFAIAGKQVPWPPRLRADVG